MEMRSGISFILLTVYMCIGISDQQCTKDSTMSYMNTMSTEDKLKRASIVLYGEDVTNRTECSKKATCSARTITFEVYCIFKSPVDGPEIPHRITIGTFDNVNAACGTIFPSNSRNELYIVLVKYDPVTDAYDWDEVYPRHTAAMTGVLDTARTTCGLSTWRPPNGATTNSCPAKNSPRFDCAYECPKSWLLIGDRCFWIDQGEKQTLEEATETCQNQDAHLLSIQAESLWKTLREQLPDHSADSEQTFWTNGKCHHSIYASPLCYWTPLHDRPTTVFTLFEEIPWVSAWGNSSNTDSYVYVSSDGWRESTSDSVKRHVICDRDASASVTMIFDAPATDHLGVFCCRNLKFAKSHREVAISSVQHSIPAKDTRAPPKFKLTSDLSAVYFTILVVSSPHADVLETFKDVTVRWMVVNAVLRDDMIDAEAGNEWLSYKPPEIYDTNGLYLTTFIYEQAESLDWSVTDTLSLYATSCSGEYRCSFDVHLFGVVMGHSLALYDHKQVHLAFDEYSTYYAIRKDIMKSGFACKLLNPDIQTYGEYAICPAPSAAEKSCPGLKAFTALIAFAIYLISK